MEKCTNPIQQAEEELYELLEKNNYKNLLFPQNNNKMYYCMIISILIKQSCCKTDDDVVYKGIIEYIVDELEKNLNKKDYMRAYLILSSYEKNILEELKEYFNRKKQNYILNKFILKEIEEKKEKRLFMINPFAFQENFEYYKKPLTQDEQIIAEILELNNIYKKEKDKIKRILIDMARKYDKKRFNEILIFIICNSYQNAIESNNKQLHDIIMENIESNKRTNNSIIDSFIIKKEDIIAVKKQLNYILQAFIYYNENIQEGRLEYLQKQPSYQYIRNKLKKPN
jgi:hypothetical protein